MEDMSEKYIKKYKKYLLCYSYYSYYYYHVVMLHISNILVPPAGLLMSLVPLWLLEYFK